MQELKVDGDKVGIMAPCKVSFENNASRDFFLGLFKLEDKKASTFSVRELADQLVDKGVVKGGVVERLAAAGVRKQAGHDQGRKKR